MSTLIAQYPFLWLFAAFLLGALVEWLLELFFLRQRLFDAESRARRRSEELDSERFAHGRTQTELKAKLGELDLAQKGRTLAESLLAAARNKLAAAETDLAAAAVERAGLNEQLTVLDRQRESAEAEAREFQSAAHDARLRSAEQEAEIATLTAAALELRANFARVSATADDAVTRLAGLERECEDRVATAAALESDLQAALRRHSDAEGALSELRGALVTAQEELDAARSARAILESSQAQLTAKIQKLEAAAASAKTSGSATEHKLKARIEEVKQLSAQFGEAAEELAALKAKSAQVQANLEAATATRMALEQELAGRDRELAGLRAAAAAPAKKSPPPAELGELRERLREQEREAVSWRSKAEELEAELLSTSRAHQQLVTEMERLRSSGPGAMPDEAIEAELEMMTRERNELAAELAVLRSARKT